LGSDESQDQHKTKEKNDEEENNEKMNTSGSETRRCIIVLTNGRAWVAHPLLERPAWRK